MRIRSMVVFAALLAICVTPNVAQAQRQGGRGGFGGGFGGSFGGFNATSLVNLPKIQEELKVSEDQKEKLTALQTEMRESSRSGVDFASLRKLPQEERQAKLAEVREKMEKSRAEFSKKIDAVLTADQKARLDQISLQLQGISALNDEKVAAALKITDAQKEKIEAAQTAYNEKRREAFRPGAGGAGAAGGRERFQEMQKAHETELMAVLTADQKEQFEKMKGEEFKVERGELFPRGGRGGFGGGARPGAGGAGGTRRPGGNRRPAQE